MKLQKTGLQTNIVIKKALDTTLKSGPTGVMGATSPAWALRQEAGKWSPSVKGLTSLPLAAQVTLMSYWAMADLCFPISETWSYSPCCALILLRGNNIICHESHA